MLRGGLLGEEQIRDSRLTTVGIFEGVCVGGYFWDVSSDVLLSVLMGVLMGVSLGVLVGVIGLLCCRYPLLPSSPHCWSLST